MSVRQELRAIGASALGKQLLCRFSGVAMTAVAVAGLLTAFPAPSAEAGLAVPTAGTARNSPAAAQSLRAGNGVLFSAEVSNGAVARLADQGPEAAVVSAMTPGQLAGQRVIYRYFGLTPPARLLSLISAGDVGGVIFFASNFQNAAQFSAAVSQLEAANQAATNPARAYPLLLMTDQEGGYVNRLPGAPAPSEKWIGSRSTAAGRGYQAGRAGSGAAANLRGYGLNVDLAPVLDVYRVAGDFDDQFQRSYSMNPQVVSSLGADFIQAVQRGGVAATAKHFPGLGAAAAGQNTDLRPVTIPLSKATLRSDDEYPYHAAISAHVDLVMVSWATYPRLGSTLPAGLSPTIVQGELRNRLGFRGVTITDAIGAGALAPFGSTENRALMAAEAGMQLILASDSVTEGTQCRTALAAGYRDGKLASATFAATVEQILTLRSSLQP
jgi:beta-N-acetylhexosaminidase